ncbi:MAG: site-2 protease family protein [Desulfobacterales bacterium]|nr:site-2 protease family protein [Desulfobacterales bacterium]
MTQLLSLSPSGMTSELLYCFAQINIILAAFNLIPLPPLDGSKILMGFAPQAFRISFSVWIGMDFFIIIALLYLGILDPVIRFFQWMILSLIKLLLPYPQGLKTNRPYLFCGIWKSEKYGILKLAQQVLPY